MNSQTKFLLSLLLVALLLPVSSDCVADELILNYSSQISSEKYLPIWSPQQFVEAWHPPKIVYQQQAAGHFYSSSVSGLVVSECVSCQRHNSVPSLPKNPETLEFAGYAIVAGNVAAAIQPPSPAVDLSSSPRSVQLPVLPPNESSIRQIDDSSGVGLPVPLSKSDDTTEKAAEASSKVSQVDAATSLDASVRNGGRPSPKESKPALEKTQKSKVTDKQDSRPAEKKTDVGKPVEKKPESSSLRREGRKTSPSGRKKLPNRARDRKPFKPLVAWNLAQFRLPKGTGKVESNEIISRDSIRIDDQNGLDLRGGWVSFPSASEQLFDGIVKAKRFSVVATITCDNENQDGPVPIISNSTDSSERNFTVGQKGATFVARIRTSKGDINGTQHETSFGTVTPGQRQSVAVIYDGRRLRCFVDGTEVEQRKFSADFDSWERMPISAGNEATGDRAWSGRIHSMAILSISDVHQISRLFDPS